MSNENRPLTVSVRNGELVIRIGVNSLACATAHGDDFHQYDDKKNEYVRNFAIVDAEKFASDLMMAMEREEETGASPLTRFLDEMAQAAIDDGSTGIEYEQRIPFEKRSRLEKWASK